MAERHPFNRVFVASVGLADDPVDDDWRADENDHVWFGTRSTELSRGDHLFAVGAGRHSAVLALYEVASAGTFPLRNPWDPDRWPFAVAVHPIASVPVSEATSVDGLVGPRGSARRIRDPGQIDELYRHVVGHELTDNDGESRTEAEESGGGRDEGESAPEPSDLPTRRAFDPESVPNAPQPGDPSLSAEALAALQEKATQGHHGLLVRLYQWLIAEGWREIEEIPRAIDLSARRPDSRRVIFEAKTITDSNELHQYRAALAQLLEYRIRHGDPDDHLCLIVDRPLSPRHADVLQRLSIGACRVRRRRSAASAKSPRRRTTRHRVSLLLSRERRSLNGSWAAPSA